jgi:hypothetical protein
MKKIKTIIIALCCLSMIAGVAIARPTWLGIERQRSHIILSQTAVIIKSAHETVTRHKVYNGFLARAIAHQHVAREFYERQKYFEAMYYSRRARALAIKAIETNGGLVPADSGYLESDAEFFKNCPSDDELDATMMREHPKEKLKDEEIIKSKPDVDVK